ncbi:hypothetical protein tloyanaT_26270 [Thalassotalea loyana]|uniref:WxL domain-containing protein n=1 Tax=Thalassotalea loyana TaxID=280483 RepID=A0ABQ6HG19_9GAMM|nr:phage tail tube protein [Thalassotalea loyana]GLX86374.1 hypothetical protein tloyanaT_26270 [Thalassotalea loyana]
MARKFKFKYAVIALATGAFAVGSDYIVQGDTPVAMLSTGAEISPFEGEEIDRELDDGNTGASKVLLVGTHVTMTIPVELAGSGTNTLPVPYSPLVQICGRDEVAGASDVTHTRIIDGSEKDATIYFYLDGAVHKVTGCRAKMSIAGKTGELAKTTFEVTGLYQGVASNTFVKPNVAAFQTPAPIGNASTTFSLDGNNYVLKSFEFNDGNEVEYADNVGGEKVDITDFNPDGTITIEAPDPDDFNPFDVAEAHALMPISLTHGSAAGNQVNIASPNIQLGRPSHEEINGTVCYSLPFKFIDDFVITTS